MTSSAGELGTTAFAVGAISPPRLGIVRGLFTITAFASAALVFLVEPMIARLVLPTLGGSPAVWNTSLAFFQASLLLGYGYAHLLQRLKSARAQTLLHCTVLLLVALVLPLRISTALGEPGGRDPTLWLLGVLGLSIGLPFAALSATAPLVQAWYARARAGQAGAPDPYRLYAASNLGSLVALLAYPVVIEPTVTLRTQTLAWSAGYGAFVILVGALALTMWSAAKAIPADVPRATRPIPIRWTDRLVWVLLAAVPSSLMLGVTTHITSDIGSAPLLWVIPLALYLLSFIIAFQAKPLISRDNALVFQAAAFVACLLTLGLSMGVFLAQVALELVSFFLTALVCHQALAARRPPASQLTEYYLLMSLGGVIGGGFNAFVAPLLFKSVLEYPLVLALSCLARPWLGGRLSRRETLWIVLGLLGGAATVGIGHLFGLNPLSKLTLAVAVIAAFLMREKIVPFIGLCVVVFMASLSLSPGQDVILTDRSFFGVVRLSRAMIPEFGEARLMVHGSTMHGAELLDPANRCRPLLYYAPTTPIGQVFRSVQARKPAIRVGAIGMGAGTVAAYTRPGDSLRFFEIDPLVARLAEDPANFSYINGCAKGRIDHVLGDARLTLAHEPDDQFDHPPGRRLFVGQRSGPSPDRRGHARLPEAHHAGRRRGHASVEQQSRTDATGRRGRPRGWRIGASAGISAARRRHRHDRRGRRCGDRHT